MNPGGDLSAERKGIGAPGFTVRPHSGSRRSRTAFAVYRSDPLRSRWISSFRRVLAMTGR
jgi:hypothetical protein